MAEFCHCCNATLGQTDAGRCPDCGTPRPAAGWPHDARLAQTVAANQYRVVRRLGSGGFGTVYRVETVVGGLRRALKILHAEWAADPLMRERFVNEAVVLEQLNHPNIARCYAAGTLDGEDALYLLLELVDGIPLSTILRSGADSRPEPLPPARAVRVANQVASGLALAHAKEVLHRDVKPENILVVDAGSPGEQVKLVDFGIAKSLASDRTSARHVLGSPLYLAPEQLTPDGPLDHRVDLFQLGVTLFLMLTGKFPYRVEGGSVLELMSLHERYASAGPRPSELVPALAGHPALDGLVSRLLAGDRHRRPRSAVQVCEELARIEHGLIPGASASGSLGLLEALCARPGEDAWWALCRFLSTQAADTERLVASAEMLLREWPDALRRAPLSWWNAVRRGDAHPLWPLVRALDLAGLSLHDEEAADLADHPAMSAITWLALSDNHIGNDGVAALATSRHLAALQFLDLSRNRITSGGVEALAGSRHLTCLATLALAGNGLGRRGAEALAASDLPLTSLDLGDNDIQAEGAAALASSPALGGLLRLDLRGNALGSDGAGAIAVSRTLVALESLDLGHNSIGPSGAAALALAPHVGSLRTLSLAQNSLGLRGLELLLSSNRFGSLEALDLSSNDFGAQGAMALASSPFARRLKVLDVSDNRLGDAGLAALLGAPALSRLRALRAAQNDLTSAGIMLLGGAPPELEELDISRNELGEAGGTALASSLPKLGLKVLSVDGCRLGGSGLARILDAGASRLTVLGASGNQLGPEGARQIAGVSRPGSLTDLDVAHNDLGAAGIGELAAAACLKGVRSLRLDSNGLGEEAGPGVVRALESLPGLDVLHLQDNGLGPATAGALARSLLAGRLRVLDLAHNRVLDEGAVALAQGPGWPVLRELDLERNEVSLVASASILAAPGMALLCRINVAHNALSGQVDLHSLARRKIALLESSFAAVAGQAADFAEAFYARLFARYPSVKPLFARTSMKRQQQHLVSALAMIIDNLRNPDLVAHELEALGERHVDYGTFPSHYQAMAGILLDTLRHWTGDRWSAELDDAWHDGLEAIATVMLRGHQRRTASPNVHTDRSGRCPVAHHGVPSVEARA